MATYNKPSYTTKLTLIDGSTTVTFADDVATGNRAGTAARTQVLRHEAVHGTPTGQDAVETVVPYDAIMKAEFTLATAQATEPEDAFCVAEGE